jgi:hypothetical protein
MAKQTFVRTEEAFLDYLNTVGLCAWQRQKRFPTLSSLEEASGWSHGDLFNNTWFWKDDLHIEKKLVYGQYLAGGHPAFIASDLLPALIASQGDIDPRDLYEKNRLSRVALTLYEHVERHGDTPKNQLPYPPNTSQTPPLVQLQQLFLLTKVGLTGRTRGTYGYVWGLCATFWQTAFEAAGRLSVEEARETVASRLGRTSEETAPLFRWHPLSAHDAP